jgi:hypothetical protein
MHGLGLHLIMRSFSNRDDLGHPGTLSVLGEAGGVVGLKGRAPLNPRQPWSGTLGCAPPPLARIRIRWVLVYSTRV